MSSSTMRELQSEVAGYLSKKGEGWTGIKNHYYLVTHFTEEAGELARGVINHEIQGKEPGRRDSQGDLPSN